jgi:phospholipid/cholesterol/gamma-HCH transport system permease protein
MQFVARLGAGIVARLRAGSYLLSVAGSAAGRAVLARQWPRTTRDVLARQIYFTGAEALGFVALVGLLVGVAVVLQAQVWLTKVGQSTLFGPLLVAVVIRELGPLLTNFVVIGRSGTAIASELAAMRVNGEIHVLEAQGLDPFTYLVVPRIIGVMASVFCLTIVSIGVSFASGYLSGFLLDVGTAGGVELFVDGVLKAVRPADIVNVLAKTLIPGALTGAICCTEGLSAARAATEIPQAAGRAVVRSVAALFVTSAVVSVLTYL